MMNKLTTRQKQVLNCILKSIRTTGMAPTRAEIAEQMGFQSKNAATDHLKALEKKGYIKIHNEVSRGIQVIDQSELETQVSAQEDECILKLSIIGDVAAGSPIQATENIDDQVIIPKTLFRESPTYLLKVRGESMKDAGILDGDLIAVKQTCDAKPGQIIVARINDEVTVKTLDIKQGKPVLMPANKAFSPIIVAPESLIIEGVFVGLIRDPLL